MKLNYHNYNYTRAEGVFFGIALWAAVIAFSIVLKTVVECARYL